MGSGSLLGGPRETRKARFFDPVAGHTAASRSVDRDKD
jgi:hypothetical protein